MRHRQVVVLVALLALVATGCAREGGGRAQRLTVVATDHRFEGMPDEIAGGVIDLTFRNDGEADHEFFIAPIGNTSANKFAADLGKLDEGGAFPSYLRTGGVPAELEPGDSLRTRFTLPPGRYTLACTLTDAPGDDEKPIKSHATLGMFQRVTVEGGDEDPVLNAEGGDFVARDYTFDIPGSTRAGSREFIFRNEGPEQFHHMILNVFPEGTSTTEATKAFETLLMSEPGKAPPRGTPEPEEVAATGIFGPRWGQTVTLELEAGRTYVAACFIPDLSGGPPHTIGHKMYKAFTVART